MGGLTDLLETMPRRRGGARAIGAAATRMRVTLTRLELDADGAWVFGPEVEAERREEIRTVLRREPETGSERRLTFARHEFVVDLEHARLHGLQRGAELTTALLTPAQRRLRTAKFQSYGTSAAAFVVEDLDGTAHRRTDGLSWGAYDDVEVIRRLHDLPIDLFSSERVLRASMSQIDAPAFVGYEDELGEDFCAPEPKSGQLPRSPTEVAPRGGVTHWALGVIPALAGKTAPTETVRAALYTDPALARIFEATGRGSWRIPRFVAGGAVVSTPMPPDLAARAPIHFDLSIRQAMAGAGLDHAEWIGRPVAHLAINLFEKHMRNAFDRIEADALPTSILRSYDPDRHDTRSTETE